LAVCSVFHAWIANPMLLITLDYKCHTWSVTNLQSAVYVTPGFQIPCLQSSSILNPRPGQPGIGRLQCISSLDFRSHVSGHPQFEIQRLANHRLAVCSVFRAWIANPMPQIIPNFKSKNWETTDWQSAVYFMPGFQILCLRSSSILNPTPGHASDHPQF